MISFIIISRLLVLRGNELNLIYQNNAVDNMEVPKVRCIIPNFNTSSQLTSSIIDSRMNNSFSVFIIRFLHDNGHHRNHCRNTKSIQGVVFEIGMKESKFKSVHSFVTAFHAFESFPDKVTHG